jgi:hypothetical protein
MSRRSLWGQYKFVAEGLDRVADELAGAVLDHLTGERVGRIIPPPDTRNPPTSCPGTGLINHGARVRLRARRPQRRYLSAV